MTAPALDNFFNFKALVREYGSSLKSKMCGIFAIECEKQEGLQTAEF